MACGNAKACHSYNSALYNCGALNHRRVACAGENLAPEAAVNFLNYLINSGDTLFEESVGRSDFPGGSTLSLIASVKRLMTLPDDVTVLPGHGGRTSIGHERKYNPYVNR